MVSCVKGGGPPRNGVLFPPLHFAHVEYNVHRSAYPTLANYRFLKRLELKRIISIGPEEAPLQDLAEMCSKEGIELLHLEAEKVCYAAPMVKNHLFQICIHGARFDPCFTLRVALVLAALMPYFCCLYLTLTHNN